MAGSLQPWSFYSLLSVVVCGEGQDVAGTCGALALLAKAAPHREIPRHVCCRPSLW